MADYRYPHIVQRPSKPPEEYAKIEVGYFTHVVVCEYMRVCACVCVQFRVIVCFQLVSTIGTLCFS